MVEGSAVLRGNRNKRRPQAAVRAVFTLRLSDEAFDQIGILAADGHCPMITYIAYARIRRLEETKRGHGQIHAGPAADASKAQRTGGR